MDLNAMASIQAGSHHVQMQSPKAPSFPALVSGLEDRGALLSGVLLPPAPPAMTQEDRIWVEAGFVNGTHLSVRSGLQPPM